MICQNYATANVCHNQRWFIRNIRVCDFFWPGSVYDTTICDQTVRRLLGERPLGHFLAVFVALILDIFFLPNQVFWFLNLTRP